MKLLVLLMLLLMLVSAVAATPSWRLSSNQTASDAAANMTRALYGDGSQIICPAISVANVLIKPAICKVEVTARCPSYVSGAIAPLYATYLKQHPDYVGILALSVYALDKTLVMTTTISNEDARANYEGIAYLMEKNADYLQYPAKRTDGLDTPLGIGE